MILETPFNAMVRAALKRQGLQCRHIRETENPGVLDLIIFKDHLLVSWLELKVGDNPLEASQEEFIKDHPNTSRVLRLNGNEDTWSLTLSRYPFGAGDFRNLVNFGANRISLEASLNRIAWMRTLLV